MTDTPATDGAAERIPVLDAIVERDQVWQRMAATYGVSNPVPPWKTSLDGLCDALDRSTCEDDIPRFDERRAEEDTLAAQVYAGLPYPESQLVALAHSLVARGAISEAALAERMAAVRERLEA
jgi:hypothetical protein